MEDSWQGRRRSEGGGQVSSQLRNQGEGDNIVVRRHI